MAEVPLDILESALLDAFQGSTYNGQSTAEVHIDFSNHVEFGTVAASLLMAEVQNTHISTSYMDHLSMAPATASTESFFGYTEPPTDFAFGTHSCAGYNATQLDHAIMNIMSHTPS